MQPHKMPSIERRDGAAIGCCRLKHGFVGQSLVRFSQVGQCDDVVTEPAQRFDDWQRKVLVGEEARHGQLRCFVLADLPIDLVTMRAHIRPRVSEVLGVQ